MPEEIHHKRDTKFFFVLFVSLWLVLPAVAQVRGSVELAQALARLPVIGSVLHTGAHPDDEHSSMLAYLARGRHVRTAYLSATRGEGGQNLLGTEQYEAMGLLRTQELLDARRLDGAEQFFSRAMDFGFSKTSEEALAKWGHDAALADFVRVIRRFRPDVIVARFTGTPSDGHGHHQAAGILTREAFRAAADPQSFPEQIREGLEPWQVKKYYIGVNRFGPNADQPLPEGAVVLDLGDYDPILGASYNQIGGEGRVLHRSQGFAGFSARPGSSRNGFVLRDSVLPKSGPEKDLFDGLTITLDRFTEMGAPSADVEELKAVVREIAQKYHSERPEEIASPLARGLSLIEKLKARAAGGDLRFLLGLKEKDFAHALELAHGITVEALAERGELVPGTSVKVTVTLWNRAHTASFSATDMTLSVPSGWKVEAADWKAGEVAYNRNSTRVFTVSIPADAAVSQPYWLESPRKGDLFTVSDPRMIGRPESPQLMEARAAWSSEGNGHGTAATPVVYRHTDQIYGQRDQRVNVVPAVAAWTEPAALMFPAGAEKEVKVRLRNNTSGPARGKFSLAVPNGWSVSPPEQEFDFSRPGEDSSYRFRVKPGAKAAAGMAAVSSPYSTGYQVINYPHITPQYWFRPAETKLQPVDLKIAPGRKVGYIMGAGDEVPAALRQLGATVTMLEVEDLLSGNLSLYHAIVVGIRAYTVRPDLVAANHRLLDYARGGGILIVQYQSGFGFGATRFAYGPFPMEEGRPAPRVTVEEAPVEFLVPGHPLLNKPNRIAAADFEGWVQERGLYFMSQWAPDYTALLSSHDPGEPPQKGGMLAARAGKGLYIYTAYAWFRQLPAGVPGAYRIWANMLSWSPEK